MGVAWAVCEHFISLGAATLFATHFSALSELAALYPTAKLWHFGLDACSGTSVRYAHRLLPSSAAPAHYGLLLAPAVRRSLQLINCGLFSCYMASAVRLNCIGHISHGGLAHTLHVELLSHGEDCWGNIPLGRDMNCNWSACATHVAGYQQENSIVSQVGLPESVVEEAARVASAVEAAEARPSAAAAATPVDRELPAGTSS